MFLGAIRDGRIIAAIEVEEDGAWLYRPKWVDSSTYELDVNGWMPGVDERMAVVLLARYSGCALVPLTSRLDYPVEHPSIA